MNELTTIATDLLNREALYLDTQRWDEWLALFTDDTEYWVPAWKGDHTPTENPKRELSLIYYASRAGLEDRVWRARSGKSVAAAVLPRTHHAISNILLHPGATMSAMFVSSYWTTHQYLVKDKEVEVFFGRSEHALECGDGAWRIAKKKVILLNDYLPAKIDFYSL